MQSYVFNFLLKGWILSQREFWNFWYIHHLNWRPRNYDINEPSFLEWSHLISGLTRPLCRNNSGDNYAWRDERELEPPWLDPGSWPVHLWSSVLLRPGVPCRLEQPALNSCPTIPRGAGGHLLWISQGARSEKPVLSKCYSLIPLTLVLSDFKTGML